MRTLKCDNCGAGIQTTGDSPNVKCEYCGTIVRLRTGDDRYFSTTAIIQNINMLGTRIRGDSFNSRYELITQNIERHAYIEAAVALNRILEEDITQARAWYYKALLPVLEQESVLYAGCYINVKIISQITDRRLIHKYLTNCGLPRWRHKHFMAYYGSMDFLYEQQIRFIDKAIEHASTPERKDFMKKRKKEIQRREDRKIFVRGFSTFMWLLLLAGTVVLGYLLFKHAFESLLL
jgi:DNA-directed RNA polymerase subunit RPC12/RpoP